jgi:CheY-like chemotaxis protein
VESAPHSGTKFLVYLPIGSGTPEAARKIPEELVQKGTETILVAEDHEGLLEVAKEILESLGYRVLLSKSGEEALEVFQEHHKSINLVLLDVVMPAMNGPTAYQRMLTINPNLRAIFVSGYASEEQSLISVARKGVVHLQKPYGSKVLGQKVRALLDEPL